jgi:hypothetical protein
MVLSVALKSRRFSSGSAEKGNFFRCGLRRGRTWNGFISPAWEVTTSIVAAGAGLIQNSFFKTFVVSCTVREAGMSADTSGCDEVGEDVEKITAYCASTLRARLFF